MSGLGIVRRVGWMDDEEHGRVFRAHVDFLDGPPDLTASVVWNQTPVRIVLANASAEPEPEKVP